MAANISGYLSSFKADLARPSRFTVDIPVPLKLIQFREMSERLTFRCEAAQLPSISLSTAQRKIYGPTEKQPYATMYNDAMMVFVLDGDMKEKKFFDAWIRLINPDSSYNLNYKTDYTVPITVTQYDVTGNKTYSVTMNEAFPVSLNQLDLDWSNETMFHKLYVDFAFHTWQENGISSMISSIEQSAIGTAVNMATDAISSLSQGKTFNPFATTVPDAQIYSMKSIGKFLD